MSDIQKKTLPPGSWPGSKSGGPKTAETSSEAGAVPRSVPKDSETNGGGSEAADDATTTSTSSHNYTHKKEKEHLDDITEEAGSARSNADTQDGEIKLKDDEQQSEAQQDDKSVSVDQTKETLDEQSPDQDQSSLNNVEPEAIQEEQGTESAKSVADDKATTHTPQTEEAASQKEGENVKVPSSETGQEQQSQAGSNTSQLTEQAKKALDLASEGKDTEEARESFIQSAKNDATAPTEISGAPQTEDQTQQHDGASTEAGGETEVPATEAQEQDQQTQQEDDQTQTGAPTSQIQEGEEQTEQQTETAPSEFQDQQTQQEEDGQTVQTSQFPEEGQEQTEQQTETAPSEFQDRPQSMTGKTVSFRSPTDDASTTSGGETQTQTGQSQTQTGQSQTGTQSQFDQSQTQSQYDQSQAGGEQQTEDQHEQQEGQTNAPESTAGVTVPEQLDFSVLKDGKVNKGGNIVSPDGQVVGRVVQGILQYLINKKVDENGDIWSENGKVIGKAEPITDSERDDMMKEPGPFEAFEDAVVDGNGMVVSNGEWVGKVVSGDLKALRGRPVDKDGDIMDKAGNVIGKAERWEPEKEEEPEPEPEKDQSLLAGKRVNKAGYCVDGQGNIFGRVVEGDPKKMVGRMCDKKGNILSESGDVIGRAELIPEGEREGFKEGPFAELQGCTVAKDGTVVTPSGDIVGRLVSGDPKVLFGRSVDEDGDVLDRNGNSIGKAERWEPEEVEKKKNPLSGRRVNKEGNVVDEDGNIIGKLTTGDPRICSGKEIDDDGDVVDGKGTVIGHCSLLDDIIPEEEESAEDKAKREQAEQDRKLAIQMAVCIEQCLDKIRPICKMITEKIDKAERTPEDERDEEALVREVRPLIEEGGRILEEAKGVIKGLDPDGRISANAKHKTAAREATPEEYHLADVLKDLTGDVHNCIENAKKKLEDMPHAKKELNPLWGLLNEPLFQILAAVGLLLSGVLGLVGRLLSGLGLGGLLDGLLGTLGINRVLDALGVGSITGGKKKSGGGLLGGVLGGGKK
ncbi:Protein of unknown function (DUF3659) domain containing protein [Rhypophila sp. PSN 637]